MLAGKGASSLASMYLILAACRNSDDARRGRWQNVDGSAKRDCLHARSKRVNKQEHTLCHRRGLMRAAKETIRVQPASPLCLGRLVPFGRQIRPANWAWQLKIRGLRKNG